MIVFCMCTYCSKLVSLSGSVWLAKMTWHIFWPLGTSFLHEAGGNWSIEPWFGRKDQSRLQQGQLKQKGPGKIQGGSFADGFPWLCELWLFLHCNVHCCSWVWLVIRRYQSFFPVKCLQRATKCMSWISVESLWVDHGWLVFSPQPGTWPWPSYLGFAAESSVEGWQLFPFCFFCILFVPF